MISYEVKVGLTVRALRNFFGMSQTELASQCGVSRPTLSFLEKGATDRHANIDTLEKLIRYFSSLGVEIELGGDGLTYRCTESAILRATNKDDRS